MLPESSHTKEMLARRPPASRRLNFEERQPATSMVRLTTAPTRSFPHISMQAEKRGSRKFPGKPSVGSPNNVEDLFSNMGTMACGFPRSDEETTEGDSNVLVGHYLGAPVRERISLVRYDVALNASPASSLRLLTARCHDAATRSPVRPSTTSQAIQGTSPTRAAMTSRCLPGGGGRGMINRTMSLRSLNSERQKRVAGREAKRQAEELARSRAYAINYVKRMQENALCAKFIRGTDHK